MRSPRPLTRPAWRIWYGDGSSWSDLDGPPELAPAFNVQLVVSRLDNGQRGIQMGKEWYWWVSGMPYSGTVECLHDHLMSDTARAVHGVKKARSVTDQQFRALVEQATTDPEFMPER